MALLRSDSRPLSPLPAAHEHEHEQGEIEIMVPEHGLLRFNDEQSGRSTSMVDRQFVLVAPQWGHSSSSYCSEKQSVVPSTAEFTEDWYPLLLLGVRR
jgi:hypothetical protein